MTIIDIVQPYMLYASNTFTVLFNGFLLLYLVKSKKQITGDRIKVRATHPLQLILILVDCTYGAASITSSIIIYFLPRSWQTTFVCISVPWPTLYLTAVSLFVRLLLNLERIVACRAPVLYKNVLVAGRRRSVAVYWTICFIPTLFYSLLAFYGADYVHRPRVCQASAARGPAMKNMLSYYVCAGGFAIIVSFFVLIFAVKKSRRINNEVSRQISTVADASGLKYNQKQATKTSNRERAATNLAVMLSIISLTMDVVPNIVLTILSELSMLNSDDLGKIVRLAFSLSLCGNLYVFVKSDPSIRQEMKKKFRLSKAIGSESNCYGTSKGSRIISTTNL